MGNKPQTKPMAEIPFDYFGTWKFDGYEPPECDPKSFCNPRALFFQNLDDDEVDQIGNMNTNTNTNR